MFCTLNANFYLNVKDYSKYHYSVQKVVISIQTHLLTIDDSLKSLFSLFCKSKKPSLYVQKF